MPAIVGCTTHARFYENQITGTGVYEYRLNGTDFDGRDANGGLIEAKANYAWAVGEDGRFKSSVGVGADLLDEAQRQLKAANGLPITWHFMQSDAAQAAQLLFNDNNIKGIKTVYTPPNF